MTVTASSIKQSLSKPISIFRVKLWVAITMFIVLALVLVLIFTLLYWRFRANRRRPSKHVPPNIHYCSMDRRLLPPNGSDIEMSIETPEKQVMYSDQWTGNQEIVNGDNINHVPNNVDLDEEPVNLQMLREIEAATNGLAYENMIGSGEHGVVFHGWLMDNTQVAVKKLFSNSSRIGKNAFAREAEELLLIRHKNLVKLLGYCAEGSHRMLVYEFVENGNLKQCLQQCTSESSPLTWNDRMKIIIGIAKGLAYLHEDTEPPLIHGNLKSSNVLLDQERNPKISDVGITKFLDPEWKHATAPPKGMSGYIAPEYDCIRNLDAKSDVYSYGILIMEIVSGKAAIESTVNEIEEYLVDWIKSNVAEENFDLIIDPDLPELPSIKELKRILLIGLRCVDLEVEKRPKMGEVLHMLEPRDLLLSDMNVTKKETSRSLPGDQLSEVIIS